MSKRLTCMLLAILLLLCGCGDTTTDTTAGSAAGSDTIDYHQNVLAQVPEVIPYDGELAIPYDPDRQVYISLANQDCDFYPETGIGVNYLSFWVLTLEPYDVSQIQVTFPAQTEYEVLVKDFSENCADTKHNHNGTNLSQYSLTYDEYMCMQQLDWLELAKQEAYIGTATKLAQAYERDSEEYKGYMALTESESDRVGNEWKQFRAVTKDHLPQFYAYKISVLFTGLGSHDEVVESMEVTLGDNSHKVDFGQWRLHTQTPKGITDSIGNGLSSSLPGYIFGNLNIETCCFNFDVTEELTVTEARLFGSGAVDAKILGGRVQMYDENWEQVLMEYLWDAQSPLTFKNGDNIRIDLCIQNDHLSQYEVGRTLFIFLDYTVRNKEFTRVDENLLNRVADPWEYYLIAFMGIDVAEYYYYRGASSWYDELLAQ